LSHSDVRPLNNVFSDLAPSRQIFLAPLPQDFSCAAHQETRCVTTVKDLLALTYGLDKNHLSLANWNNSVLKHFQQIRHSFAAPYKLCPALQLRGRKPAPTAVHCDNNGIRCNLVVGQVLLVNSGLVLVLGLAAWWSYKLRNETMSLFWPAQSPDLNITENIRLRLKNILQKNIDAITCVEELKAAITTAWMNMPDNDIGCKTASHAVCLQF